MSIGSREKDIQLLVTKFVKLVESLEPGERLSIKKVGGKKAGRKGSDKSKSTKSLNKSPKKKA